MKGCIRRKWLISVLICLLCAAVAVWAVRMTPPASPLPGTSDRRLIRLWTVSAPGGGMAWLKERLAAWGKTHPDVSVYLRRISPQEANQPENVWPDAVLWMPGDFSSPEAFTPLKTDAPMLPSLMRCGQSRMEQYALSLCWEGWAVAVHGEYLDTPAATREPAALLGRPAATEAPPQTAPSFPEKARAAEAPLLWASGGGLFTLRQMIPDPPPMPDASGLTQEQVYQRFRNKQCASALLTTGQITALQSISVPLMTLTPHEVVTEQVWLASLCKDACPEAAELLSFLASAASQQTLSQQGLFTARDDLKLYASGMHAAVESAAGNALTAPNAFLPAEQVQSAAWQAYQGDVPLEEALLPML